jgi:hypothetical protein
MKGLSKIDKVYAYFTLSRMPLTCINGNGIEADGARESSQTYKNISC